MTFKEIIDLTKNRINELDPDTEIDSIIKEAINYSYQNELGKIDKRLTKAFCPIVNGIATLPEDINTIENISPALSGSDRKVGNSILTDKTGILEVTYSYFREPLVNDNDEPELSQKYHYLLSTYGAYAYYKKKKKMDIANSYFGEYMAVLQEPEGVDNISYSIGNTYSSFGLEGDY